MRKEHGTEKEKPMKMKLNESVCRKRKNEKMLWAFTMLWAFFARILLFANAWVPYLEDADTSTYCFEKFHKVFMNAQRLPGYPLFLYLTKKAFFQESIEAAFPYVVMLQTVLSLLSVAAFYGIVMRITGRKWLAATSTVLYACMPSVIAWDRYIMSEAVALPMMVFLIYFLAEYLHRPTAKMATLIGVFGGVMVLVRPSFVFVPVIWGMFLALKWICEKVERRQRLYGGLGLLIGVALLMPSCYNNYRIYGKFMLNQVYYKNRIAMLLEDNMYENEAYPQMSLDLKEHYDETGNKYGAAYLLAEDYGLKDCIAYLKDTQKLHAAKYRNYTLEKFRTVSQLRCSAYTYTNRALTVEHDKYQETGLIPFLDRLTCPYTFLSMWLLSAIEIIYGLIIWIRRKRVPWISFGLAAFILANTITNIVGADDAWQRLSICAIPVMVLLVTYDVHKILLRVAQKYPKKGIGIRFL